jgi:hypothetical protein
LSPHYNHNTNRKQNTIVASASSKDKWRKSILFIYVIVDERTAHFLSNLCLEWERVSLTPTITSIYQWRLLRGGRLKIMTGMEPMELNVM